jgi:hypothetical protein
MEVVRLHERRKGRDAGCGKQPTRRQVIEEINLATILVLTLGEKGETLN